jgi:hypothetical protein
MNLLAPILLLALAAATLPAAAALEPYRSEAELVAVLDRWRNAAQALQPRARRESLQPIPAAPMMASKAAADSSAAAQAAPAAEASITNVQTAGVDEGGIVKRAGEYLVVLRRGRLFTVRIGADQLQPVGMADAFAPGSDPRGAWYDELLVHGNTLVVVGYSYARGGTEIGLFDLAGDGSISHRSTHHLKSFDYYSARNYASRLVGNQLVFYSPTLLQPWAHNPWAQLMPGARRWSAVPGEFQRILPATRIFRSDDDFDPREPLALHTITRCELGRGADMPCESSAVLGPAGRVFYVSASAVTVWAAGRQHEGGGAAAVVYRLPLDGAAPAALKAVGMPTDQFSFHEDASHLNVLLREAGRGEEAMAGPGASGAGRTALLRVPLGAFGDGRSAARREHYQRLPGPEGFGVLQNRFVGDWLVWGAGEAAWAARYAAPGSAATLQPGHPVERIEALGEHALLVGSGREGLVFSALRLAPRGPARLEGRLAHPGAQQGETRSHGFFYRATGPEEGLLGLPVRKPVNSGPWRGHEPAAAVVVLRQRDLAFTALGELAAEAGPRRNDRCQASCVDWYGNARPIFIGERVLALLGYEIVEGRVRSGFWGERIEETRRVDFGPGAAPRPRVAPGERPTPFE